MPSNRNHRHCTVWLVNMGDGTWVASCARCGALGRGSEARVERLAARHTPA